ncbi:hypothetical protein FHP29_15840 [Nocardioides albidus]|uniref:Uncharacterized protein n=1 Tax=Nocardioides albidus TaxID=1517589 RepID=A0A5C4VN42_9ACTN|nr:hypothetical protein [Nocardioides albidus]TNM37314.1 hypothetical protein FHP29_15840 [Nocardioides albidus]
MGILSGRLVAAVIVSLCAPALGACSSGGDAAGDEPATEPKGSRLEQALAYLPADSQAVTFTDRAVVAERLDLEDVARDAAEADLDDWAQTFLAEGYRLHLTTDAPAMRTAAFSVLDVEWEAVGSDEAGLPTPKDAVVWRMSDDLDLDAVAADLEDAGLKRSGPDERPLFQPDFSAVDGSNRYGGRYPMELSYVLLLPDEHLMLFGFGADDVLDVIDDKADSLAEAGTFDDILAQAEPEGLEYALLGLDGPCDGARRTPDGRAVGFLIHPDQPARSLRLFGSADSAQADAARLEQELAGKPVTIGVEGTTVHVDVPFADRVTANRTYLGADGPLACPR